MQSLKTTLRPELNIQNTVTTADLRQKIDIASFNQYRYLSSNLDLYKCGYVKDDSMTGRVTVFASGKLISVGTKSPQQSVQELNCAMKLLVKYKLARPVKLIPKVQNIVARFDVGRTIPLEKLARILPRCMYEPEQFPGVIYRIKDSTVALLFASGRGVLVGARSFEELNSAFLK
ncbi:MAG: hypothetical protein LDL06_05060 [Candidatus Nitrosotenuis sp.]|nr:hypothetical protein [Candidatus Nitrosotenuis sp.]